MLSARVIIFMGIILMVSLQTIAQKPVQYPAYDVSKIPPAPDYDWMQFWAAHPLKEDPSDLLPGKGQFKKQDPLPDADVFFIHPTIYTGDQNPAWPWQGNVYNEDLNEKTDKSTIKYQASAFNGSAHVYAPRYRQAHLNIFRVQDSLIYSKSLDLAYEDVRTAFLHYLSNFNKGKPVVIASHSQGTLHAQRLIKELIDGEALQEKLIAAYLVGYAIDANAFHSIKPCERSVETGCWVSWNTFEKEYYPPRYQEVYARALSTNPLNWKIDDTYAPASENKGSVLRNFRKVYKNLCDAQNHEGLLWINKPKFFGSMFYRSKRYHIADYSLFYGNVRANVKERIEAYGQLQRSEQTSRQ